MKQTNLMRRQAIIQFKKDILSILDQYGHDLENKELKPLLVDRYPKYNTMEWGDRFRNAIDQLNKAGKINKPNKTTRTIRSHERSYPGGWSAVK